MKTRVLIVEDEGLVGLDLQFRLERLGFEIVGLVDCAAEAVQMVRAEAPALVLMDIRIRGEPDGVDAAREIATRFSTPVIFLTGNADEATMRRATDAEPYGYLVKPIDDRELSATIETALRRARAEARLRQLEHWLTTTLQSMTDGVLVTDSQERVCFMNRAAEHLTGWSLGEALGRPLTEVAERADLTRSEHTQLAAGVRATRRPAQLSEGCSLRQRDGALLPVLGTMAPVLDEGEVTGVVLTLRPGRVHPVLA